MADTNRKIPFNKKGKTSKEHIDLMESRGLLVPDYTRAESYLDTIGYYRLSAYFKPFQKNTSGDFNTGVSFSDVLDLYIADRQLRLLVMDAVERIEVAVRSIISNTMCSRTKDPFWYLNGSNFAPHFLSPNKWRPETNDFDQFIGNVKFATGYSLRASRHDACRHYYSVYYNPNLPEGMPDLPPSWIMIETQTMGAWFKIFRGLKKNDRKRISKRFGFSSKEFGDWLEDITQYRNSCAHHERIWNRIFVPKARKVDQFTHQGVSLAEPYGKIAVVYYWLKQINPTSKWPDRLKVLLDDWPLDPYIHMGFPEKWYELPFWRVTKS